jgi:DNA-binding NtrC family response regulator
LAHEQRRPTGSRSDLLHPTASNDAGVVTIAYAEMPSIAARTEQDMPEPHRILAVDNDVDCSDRVIGAAHKLGYAGLAATDPFSIDDAIRNWRPHVITLDLCLPEIDGMQIISLIKAMRFTGDVIIISGEPEWIRDLTRGIAVESGLNVPAHMAKPVDYRRLHELLARSASRTQ